MFDNAVFNFGTALSNALAEVEGKNKKEIERKSQRVLRKWLGSSSPGKFRDPAKKVKL